MIDKKIFSQIKFKNPHWVAYLAYLANMFKSINIFKKVLQEENSNIISARGMVSAFELLEYWRHKVEQYKIAYFQGKVRFWKIAKILLLLFIKENIVRYLIKAVYRLLFRS